MTYYFNIYIDEITSSIVFDMVVLLVCCLIVWFDCDLNEKILLSRKLSNDELELSSLRILTNSDYIWVSGVSSERRED